jgi:DNA-3-methyladenine glycosylase II
MSDEHPEYAKARRHLSRRDPVLKKLIAQYGAVTLQPSSDHFGVLVRCVVAQQISTKAAASISSRLCAALGKKGLKAHAIARLEEEKIRECGLSTAKTRAVRDLAAKVLDGTVDLTTIHLKPDEEVIEHLMPVCGIGRWTAEMFLIFALGRLDVLPLGDLGFRVGVQRQLGLEEVPDKTRLVEIAELWRPYRTVATWYLWRSFGPVPQS